MADSSHPEGGIGFVGVLTVLFIGLKLTRFIDWSWWWVLSPIWITAGIALVFISFCLFMALITGQLGARKPR